ncbi:unnamed protein product, partial [Ectocarpus sp. 12 AP-2014]
SWIVSPPWGSSSCFGKTYRHVLPCSISTTPTFQKDRVGQALGRPPQRRHHTSSTLLITYFGSRCGRVSSPQRAKKGVRTKNSVNAHTLTIHSVTHGPHTPAHTILRYFYGTYSRLRLLELVRKREVKCAIEAPRFRRITRAPTTYIHATHIENNTKRNTITKKGRDGGQIHHTQLNSPIETAPEVGSANSTPSHLLVHRVTRLTGRPQNRNTHTDRAI